MTTTKKLAIAVIALSVALACVIGGTLAFLVASSNEVKNTFTYGDIRIELLEEDLTNDTGMAFEDVVPGDVHAKDPTVVVKGDSEACYVYVLIDNQLGNAAEYDIAAEWIKVGEKGTEVLYRYREGAEAVVNKSDADQTLPVFTKMTFASSLSVKDIEALEGKDVVINAYAHQADNTDQATADDAALLWAFPA